MDHVNIIEARFDSRNPESAAKCVIDLANESQLHPLEILAIIGRSQALSPAKVFSVAILIAVSNPQFLDDCCEKTNGDICYCAECNIARFVTWVMRDKVEIFTAMERIHTEVAEYMKQKHEGEEGFSA